MPSPSPPEPRRLGVDAGGLRFALHDALGGDVRAVLIGHDWGASTAYGTASFAPDRFTRVVALAVPPGPVVFGPLGSPRRLAADAALVPGQLRRSWYMGLQQLPWIAERALPRLVPRLWRDWSPGFDGRADAAAALEALAPPGHAAAALGYYRAMAQPWRHQPAYAAQQRHWLGVPRVPTLYLHGADDGCLTAAFAERAAPLLPEGSRVEVVAGTGHFLQLEDPATVNGLIGGFVRQPVDASSTLT